MPSGSSWPFTTTPTVAAWVINCASFPVRVLGGSPFTSYVAPQAKYRLRTMSLEPIAGALGVSCFVSFSLLIDFLPAVGSALRSEIVVSTVLGLAVGVWLLGVCPFCVIRPCGPNRLRTTAASLALCGSLDTGTQSLRHRGRLTANARNIRTAIGQPNPALVVMIRQPCRLAREHSYPYRRFYTLGGSWLEGPNCYLRKHSPRPAVPIRPLHSPVFPEGYVKVAPMI